MEAVDPTWRDQARRRTSGRWPRTSALSRGALISAAVALQGVLGCNGTGPGETRSAGTGTPEPQAAASCESLSVEQCAVSARWPEGHRCEAVIGTSFETARRCQVGMSAVACRDATRAGCDAAVVYATDPTGRVWRLPDTCAPGGWTVIHPQDGQYADWSSCDGSEADCGALTIDLCEMDSRCLLITGTPYDETRICIIGKSRVVGCGSIGASAMGTCARDPSGVTWVFPDTRNPRGWTAVRQCPYPEAACSALASGGT